MTEPRKMTELEKVLADQESAAEEKPKKVRKVHWPVPGTGGVPHPGGAIGAKAGEVRPAPKPASEHVARPEVEAEEKEKAKPPIALIAVAVLLLIIAGVVFMVVRGKGGSEAPVQQAEQQAQEQADNIASKAPKGGGETPPAPPAPKPAGGGGGGGGSSKPPATSPPPPPKKEEPKPDPIERPSEAKVSQQELDQLNQAIKENYAWDYEKVKEIVGGEGRKLAEDYDQQGNLVQVYEWPGEGLEKEYVHVQFTNGRLSKVNLM